MEAWGDLSPVAAEVDAIMNVQEKIDSFKDKSPVPPNRYSCNVQTV